MKIEEAHPDAGCASSVFTQFCRAPLQNAGAVQKVDLVMIRKYFTALFHTFAQP